MKKVSTKERLSAREFERIEKLVKQKISTRNIARLLDRSTSTISRQINNSKNQDDFKDWGKWTKRFSAAKAVENQKRMKKERGRIPKLTKDKQLRKYLEESIKKKKWSPKIALGYAKKNGFKFKESVSVKTVYNSIYRHELEVTQFDLHLKLRRNQPKEKRNRIWKRIYGKKIDERPDISDRKEFGHWEIDTVFWTKECAVLTLVERKTRYCKILKLDNLTSDEVNKKLKSLNLHMNTLTTDNGSEFAKLIDFFENTYFAHPYSAWEKGSIENLNGLIRRYLPRSISISEITPLRLAEVEAAINNLPRPIHNYATAKELYDLEDSMIFLSKSNLIHKCCKNCFTSQKKDLVNYSVIKYTIDD